MVTEADGTLGAIPVDVIVKIRVDQPFQPVQDEPFAKTPTRRQVGSVRASCHRVC